MGRTGLQESPLKAGKIQEKQLDKLRKVFLNDRYVSRECIGTEGVGNGEHVTMQMRYEGTATTSLRSLL